MIILTLFSHIHLKTSCSIELTTDEGRIAMEYVSDVKTANDIIANFLSVINETKCEEFVKMAELFNIRKISYAVKDSMIAKFFNGMKGKELKLLIRRLSHFIFSGMLKITKHALERIVLRQGTRNIHDVMHKLQCGAKLALATDMNEIIFEGVKIVVMEHSLVTLYEISGKKKRKV